VLKDPELAPFFEGASIDRLYGCSTSSLPRLWMGRSSIPALDPPGAFRARDREGTLRAVVNHLIDTLTAWQLSEQEIIS